MEPLFVAIWVVSLVIAMWIAAHVERNWFLNGDRLVFYKDRHEALHRRGGLFLPSDDDQRRFSADHPRFALGIFPAEGQISTVAGAAALDRTRDCLTRLWGQHIESCNIDSGENYLFVLYYPKDDVS